jgi:hypothetical protein
VRAAAFTSAALVALALDATTTLAQEAVPPELRRPAAPIRVCAGGDVTLGNNLDPGWARMAAARLRDSFSLAADPDSLLMPLRPLVADADLVFLNIEGAIGSGPATRKCGAHSTNCFAFRMPVSAAAAMRALNPQAQVIGNVANNHGLDAGWPGLRATVGHLEQAGVHVAGVDSAPAVAVTARGDTVAFLGFHTTGDFPDARDTAAVRRHVAAAAERYPLVVVGVHIGAEGVAAQRTADRREIFLRTIDRGNPVAFATAAFAGGATVVFGHGPHVMRAAEWRDERLVFYSLGNLITYGPFSNREPVNRGAIACADIAGPGRVTRAVVRSTVQLAPGVLLADSTGRAAALVDSLSALDFPRTGVTVGPDGAVGRREGSTARVRGGRFGRDDYPPNPRPRANGPR